MSSPFLMGIDREINEYFQIDDPEIRKSFAKNLFESYVLDQVSSRRIPMTENTICKFVNKFEKEERRRKNR